LRKKLQRMVNHGNMCKEHWIVRKCEVNRRLYKIVRRTGNRAKKFFDIALTAYEFCHWCEHVGRSLDSSVRAWNHSIIAVNFLSNLQKAIITSTWFNCRAYIELQKWNVQNPESLCSGSTFF
jgi:predicted nucleic-acid-binding Zn-ribbon protein